VDIWKSGNETTRHREARRFFVAETKMSLRVQSIHSDSPRRSRTPGGDRIHLLVRWAKFAQVLPILPMILLWWSALLGGAARRACLYAGTAGATEWQLAHRATLHSSTPLSIPRRAQYTQQTQTSHSREIKNSISHTNGEKRQTLFA
jgi:hypothetical protein